VLTEHALFVKDRAKRIKTLENTFQIEASRWIWEDPNEGFQAQRPDDPALQPALAVNYYRVGYILAELGRHAEAQVAYDKAAVLYAQLTAAHPEVPDYQIGLATTYTNLGLLQGDAGQPAAALKAYERARDLREQLRAAHPDVPAYQIGLATTYTNLGILQGDTGQPAAARKAYERAREVFEQLSAAHPKVPLYQDGLASTYVNLGSLQRDTGRPQEGLAGYAKAIALLQAVRQREPKNPKARQYLRNGHWGRAASLTALGRYREALADWDRALELDDGSARQFIRLGRALALAHAGQHDRAMAEVQDLAQDKARTATDLYNLACAAALAADSARQDGRLSPPTREKLAEQNAGRVVELLKQAHAAGFFKDYANAELLKTAKDLDPLRARADFQQLAAAVGKAVQK
jgi:tetratricopeptide (TPR) repeat protein